MRIVAGACLLGLWSALLVEPVLADQSCANRLGVSRTIEVDTTGGPWFGAPLGDQDFLAPGEVVLTFDDGPSPRSTVGVLAALAAECTKATFFVVGEMAAAHPDIVREMAVQGHTIGTHTWSHPNLKRLSEAQMKVQIESAFTAAETGAGQPIAPFFRYPYLSHTPASAAYLRTRNIAQFAIDIDSFDWRTRHPQSVVRRVAASLHERGRGIILLHDIHPSTAAAVPLVLALLKEKGFKVVHLRPKMSVETQTAHQMPAKERVVTVATRRRLTHGKSWFADWKWPAW
jgi:peptidoglycan/xylan/chitin deacetylase (PgdA/CDA1 family)